MVCQFYKNWKCFYGVWGKLRYSQNGIDKSVPYKSGMRNFEWDCVLMGCFVKQHPIVAHRNIIKNKVCIVLLM